MVVQLAKETQSMTARVATEEEAQELWPRLVSMFQIWERFQQHSARTFPLVILSPAGEGLEAQTAFP